MTKLTTKYLSGLALALVVVLFSAGFNSPAEPRLNTPAMHWRTAAERADTLDAMREAWESRPLVASPDNERAERIFLNRVMYFLKRTRRQEVFHQACGFWNETYHEHSERYGDFLAAN